MHHHFSVVFSICKCMTFLSVLKEVNQIVLNPPYFPRGEKRLDIRGLFYKTPPDYPDISEPVKGRIKQACVELGKNCSRLGSM